MLDAGEDEFSRHREIDSDARLPMEEKLSLVPKIECGRSWQST